MSKILGIDLGTNSIGWALRNTMQTGNQIEKFGVLTFKQGVGLGKSGEYSYAAERTKKRSVRRLYQARKYRLWATLEVLINEGCCPLPIQDLDRWRHYDKKEARKNRNGGRVYPADNVLFDAWIKLDFNNDGRPDYASPYQLRKELAEKPLDFTQEINRHKLGRALYHIAQRRGFKSSRKNADKTLEGPDNSDVVDLQYSEKKKNKDIEELFAKYNEAKTIGWLFALLEKDGIRIRNSIAQYAIRENYKEEIKYIFQKTQNLGIQNPLYHKLVESSPNKNDGFIFYKRPLRSQKGLVGKCTLEPNKYRAPTSHPAFETFRAWAFLNNIKYKDGEEWKQLPLKSKQQLYTALFFRKTKEYFPFSEISDFLEKNGKAWQLNYSPKTTVSGCPVSARLKDIFGDKYMEVRIPKDKAPKSAKAYYDIQDIWHVLFSYQDQENVSDFAESKLQLDTKKVRQFITLWNMMPVGYAMLSLAAIRRINRFLQKGLIYTEATLLAKIPILLGNKWRDNETLLLNSISQIIAQNREHKAILTIVNNLVSKHKSLGLSEKFGYKDNSFKLDESDLKDVQTLIEEQFGTNTWAQFPDETKRHIFTAVRDCYQGYFSKQGIVRDIGVRERIVAIKSGNSDYYKTESGYFRLPRLVDTLKTFLKENFGITDERVLARIYHPSEINIYPIAKTDDDGIVKLGSPKIGSFKNPMAMRTLHRLRNLLNHMIETSQIDTETRVVVEVARELNDSNKRWAIETWQRERERENAGIAAKIKELRGIVNISNEDIDKARLLIDQQISDAENSRAFELKVTMRDIYKKTKERNDAEKKLIEKYRFWLEQSCQCIYTGKIIGISELFNENTIDFEHTLPRSKSFDNSLANLTVCFADYNRNIKRNQIPTQLPNYDTDYDFGGRVGICTAIKPRLKAWEEKVDRIKQQIDFWKTKSKKASDKPSKDSAIRQRHLWQLELDYWQNKLDRFKITEITTGFKNSQKVDTQLISKYAFHYLKSYFEKVDLQKGIVTAEFRKIYQVQSGDETKDRSKHSHHAKDAAVLTLIPAAVKRDEIREKAFAYFETTRKQYHELPYKGFKPEFISFIDDNVLVNNTTRNQELTPAKRKVRVRAKDGTTVNRVATGDCIRGQLHLDTFYGAIKPAIRGEKGNLLKNELGKFIQEQDVKYVVRIPFQYKKDSNVPGFKTLDDIKNQIVDEGIKMHIEKQVSQAGGLKQAFEKGIYLLKKDGTPHGSKIRHIRVWASVAEPLAVKNHTYLSNKEYKRRFLAANATNSLFAVYKNDVLSFSTKRSLFDIARMIKVPVNSPSDLFEPRVFVKKDGRTVRELTEEELKNGQTGTELVLAFILERGAKVVFKRVNEDVKSLSHDEILRRLYVFTNFEKDGRLNFQYHLEARNKIDESYSEAEVDFSNPKPTLRFNYSKYDFAVEGYDFDMALDGTIRWK